MFSTPRPIIVQRPSGSTGNRCMPSSINVQSIWNCLTPAYRLRRGQMLMVGCPEINLRPQRGQTLELQILSCLNKHDKVGPMNEKSL